MRVGFFIIALVIVACSGPKEAVQIANTPVSPDWVERRPISSMYYIGIGVAQKVPGTDFRSVAKSNAFSDLASEIKVNVNANSLLYTLEREYKFEQEFRETIRTGTDLSLEDFEPVDQWEGPDVYWVYYRLNKADWARQQAEKKEAATSLALDFLAKAESSEKLGAFSSSVDYYLRGLQALEEFWGEQNQATYRGNTIYVDNTLFSGVKSMLNGVSIAIDETPVLNFSNKYTSSGDIQVTAGRTGQPLESLPLKYVFQGKYGRVRGAMATNIDGRITVPIIDAEKAVSGNALEVSIDTESLYEAFSGDEFMRELTKSLNGKEMTFPIVYEPPTIFIQSSEKNLGGRMSGKPIESAMIESLVRKDVDLTEDRSQADLIIKIDADTKKTGEAQGFSTVRLEMQTEVTNARTGESEYKIYKDDIKGVDLTFEKAGVKAYRNLTKNIESELMRKLTNDLF